MLEWVSSAYGCGPHAVRLVEGSADEAGLPAIVSGDALTSTPALPTSPEAGVDEGDLTPWQRNLVRHSPENFARPDSSQSLVSLGGLDLDDGEFSAGGDDAPGLDLEDTSGPGVDDRDAAAAAAAAADALAAADATSAPPPPLLMISPLRTVPSDEWGHFKSMSSADHLADVARTPTAGATPDYVVEEPLESQALWHATAGTQPPQPKHERDFYEDLYAKRLEQSAASLRIADSSPRPPGSEHVRWRVSNSFGGESALRSWQCHRCPEVCTMSLSLTKLQTVDAGRWRGHAEFLVVAKIGSCKVGRWRSFSDFKRLARTLWTIDARLSRLAGGMSRFVNAQHSWACVRRRQHCFRNLDVEYLTIKAFLLERFLHDALYEAPTAEVFNEFLEIKPARAAAAPALVSFASSRSPSLSRS